MILYTDTTILDWLYSTEVQSHAANFINEKTVIHESNNISKFVKTCELYKKNVSITIICCHSIFSSLNLNTDQFTKLSNFVDC